MASPVVPCVDTGVSAAAALLLEIIPDTEGAAKDCHMNNAVMRRL